MEMMRINGHSTKERLLDVEVCLEQIHGDNLIRQYVLISTMQCYVCRQPRPELENSLASLEVVIDMDDRRLPSHIWCGRYEVARRLADKMMQAKREYDHSKRTLNDQDCIILALSMKLSIIYGFLMFGTGRVAYISVIGTWKVLYLVFRRASLL
ncbi:hypothetical protein DICVIV_05019 [Dictyocaulus viviparus]|uniref:Uncharacterized protein n=1 Tax=Dictyocaulus viviparus TaxID=29172 RepID=A0A0D8XYJ9_DICVI|nr:hypothetical protein DICVIV_05019 [Dictyocaulus viviparus]